MKFEFSIKPLILSLVLMAPLMATAAEEAATVTSSDGVVLSGKWNIPAEAKEAVLILQGSGNVAADGDVSSFLLGAPYRGGSGKLSEQMAEALAAKGVASLRYSKRGVENA